MNIFMIIAQELGVGAGQVEAAVKLLDEGSTVPFIARYRKEKTGALNDEVLRSLSTRLEYLRSLQERKEKVIAAEVVGDSLIVNLVDESRYMQSHVPYTIKVVATDEAGATAIAKTLIFITDPNKVFSAEALRAGVLLRRGKKNYYRVVLK